MSDDEVKIGQVWQYQRTGSRLRVDVIREIITGFWMAEENGKVVPAGYTGVGMPVGPNKRPLFPDMWKLLPPS